MAEGYMCGTALARCRRSAGVGDHITQEGIASEPGRSGSVRRLVAGGGIGRGRTAGRCCTLPEVGSTHSTCEAAEGNEAVEGRGRLEGIT